MTPDEVFAQSAINFVKNDIENRILPLIEKKLLELVQARVPIDTEELQTHGFTSVAYKLDENTYVAELFANGLMLQYGRIEIPANKLTNFLEIGLGKSGLLKRSRDQPKNPAGSPTKGFFQQTIEDIKEFMRTV